MRIQNTQNTNFRAIQIKGLQKSTESGIATAKIVQKNKKFLEVGENFWGTTAQYIRSAKDSLLEQKIMQELLGAALSGEKGIQIKSVSDKVANENIDRFLNDGPSIRKLF